MAIVFKLWNDRLDMAAKLPSFVDLQGPGLRKAKRGSVRSQRQPQLLRLNEGWIAFMFRKADLISEGAVRTESGTKSYYGSTSIGLCIDAASLAHEGHEAQALGAALLADPFTRLHVLRLARREATSRAGASLDVAYSEVTAEVSLSGGDLELLFQIDLNAELLVCDAGGATGT